MRKTTGTIFAAVLATTVSCAAQNEIRPEMKIAFFGDSITNFGNANPQGYVNLVMDGLTQNGISAKKIPSGVNGNDSRHLLARIDRDVIAMSPDILILSCGVNDVIQQYDGGTGGVPIEPYRDNITRIIDKAQAAGIRVFLMTATPLGEDPGSERNARLSGYNQFLHSIAKEKKCVLIDPNAALWKKYKELKKNSPEHRGDYFTCDGIHLNRIGDIVLAEEILRVFGIPEGKLRKLCSKWEKSQPEKSKIVIEKGLFDNMVMQRNREDVSEQKFSGTTAETSEVFYSCGNSGKILCGEAKNGHFSGVLKGLKTGGPYDLELSVGREKRRIGNILVGDVWILAGQSNMQGRGRLREAYRLNSPNVRAFYMNDVWDVAADPITVPGIANARVHWNIMGKSKPEKPECADPLGKGTGPGVAFGNELLEITGVPQGLIACAHGGTRLEQWEPAMKKSGDESLYGAMMNRIERNGGCVSGILWYQGESDTTNEDVSRFAKRMDRFVNALRRDLKNPELPFIQVQLARLIDSHEETDTLWNAIRMEQRLLGERHKQLFTVPAIDLEMDDTIHITGTSQNLLGKRMAYAVCSMRGRKGFLPPIEFGKAEEKRIPGDSVKKIEIEIMNVSGNLTADGRPSGFTLNGKRIPEIIRTELHGNRAILYVAAGLKVESVSYGFGANPFCNIVDGANRSLPCFTAGVSAEFVRTPYVEKMWISPPVLMEYDVRKVTCKDIPLKDWYAQPASGCWMLPGDLKKTPQKPGFRFFKVKYSNPRTQRLKILAGYDAPVKIFCDEKEIHVNPDGTNPIIPDQYCIETEWEKGIHEIVVAEAMHNGNAYGITLALEGFKNTAFEDLPILMKEKKK